MSPGKTVSLGSGVLATGDEYSSWLTRLDAGQDDRTNYYLLSAVGRARGAGGGRRQVALVLRTRQPDVPCCGAALATRGAVHLEGGAMILGVDLLPKAWRGAKGICALGAAAAAVGVSTDDTTLVERAFDALVTGHPPIALAEGAGIGPLALAASGFGELAGRVNHRYPQGATLGGIGPRRVSDAECFTSSPSNWGAPTDPADPCFDYFPVIHAAGDLRVSGPGRGQGVLLVEGDLEVDGGFEFFGIVIVKGRLRAAGPGVRIVGGVLAFNSADRTSVIADGAALVYSSCAASRAARASQLHMPHPLAERAWFEIFR
jgi:hypothetical protein